MAPAPAKNGNGNGWALKILVGVATLLWGALLSFLITVARNQASIQRDQASMKTSVANIEVNIAAIVSARAAEAVEATRMNRQRIQDLESRANQRAQ